MLSQTWIAALSAVFLWWFSTGLILLIVRSSAGGRGMSTIWTLPVLLGGLAAFWLSLGMEGTNGAYLGFAAALAIWGWIELAFLTGVITGPNVHPCPPHAPFWERFIRAWGTIAYHEMLLAAAGLALLLASYGQPNTAGVWTFGVLFAARISAELNLFFGVPKFNTEFLPEHLAHLPSHFKTARMNWLFPVSVTALSVLVASFAAAAGHADTASQATSFVLLATLTGLALLEHWLLVLPLPDAKLWRWMLPDQKPQKINVPQGGRHGF